MEDKIEIAQSVKLVSGIALLFIFFWGDPDIADAIIYWLTDGAMLGSD